MPRPHRRTAAWSALVIALLAGTAHADPDATAQREIDHLLDFVAASNCTFVRNGERYPALKARDHLAMKYRFTRGRLHTAEEFISYLATESSTSHEPYKIVCGTNERAAGAWLSEELARFRKTVAAKS
jgi:Family of unknown function (DUF5329)